MMAKETSTKTTSCIVIDTSPTKHLTRMRFVHHFEHAIECLVKDLWLGTVIHPEYEAGIHRRSNWYSETPQYRDPNLTYKQVIAAYDDDLVRRQITILSRE